MLDYKSSVYEECWVSYSQYDLNKVLTGIKKELSWLDECNAQSLQYSIKNLDDAYKRFFKWLSKYPKFKKKSNHQSITYPQWTSITDTHIKLPKIWLIKTVFHRPCFWNIKRMTIVKTPTNKYYVSILTDCEERKPISSEAVGIDVWLKSFAVLSDWTTIDNPKFLKKKLRKLKKLQRMLSRKQKWSSNRKKFRLVVARQYEKITNQREDFLHKVSASIAKQYWVVAMEKLDIKWMLKNRNLAQAISDVGWYKFKTFLSYKTKVVEIDTFKPSSKTCSRCWCVKEDLTLNDRIYHCDSCHLDIDRDLNASINIKTMAGV